MSNYGRNFELTVPPNGNQRKGRFYNAAGADIPIGAPVTATNGAANSLGLEPVDLQDGAASNPIAGRHGIAVYEYGPNGYAGDDPVLTTYSDKDVVPDGAAVQVVSGTQIKVRLRNTPASSTFLNTRTYTGRTMVAGVGATPTVAVGDYLEPQGTPNDTNGYWVETATLADAWLVVTKVDSDRDEVEAQMMF
jgi:hypothetical protein